MIISSINFVSAEEYPEVTKDIEIRYRWYKEKVSQKGSYVHKKDILPTDTVDTHNYKTGTYSWWSKDFCYLSREYYEIQETKYITYKKLNDARYVLIETTSSNNGIKIFYKNKEIEFEFINVENNKIKIDLKKTYLNEYLLFFVDTTTDYKISIYSNQLFTNHIISKEIKNTKISIPDETWTDETTTYKEISTTQIYPNSSLTKKISEESECRYRDIFVYKYDIEKEYYDNNYYQNVDGYIKDINDYKFYYKGEPIVNNIINTIEVPVEVPVEVIKEKIVKIPQIEYVYIEKEKNDEIKNNDSSKQDTECPKEIETKIETQYVEKEISKIPIVIYVSLFILIITILVLSIKLHKKNVI